MATLTLGERNQIRAIKAHLATIEYQSYSATTIWQLLKIIERLTESQPKASA